MSVQTKLRRYYTFALIFLGLCFMPAHSSAQQLLVSVRDHFGEPLSEQAVVTVSQQGGAQVSVANTGNLPTAISTAVFQLSPGEYDVEVEAVGYNKGTEHASLSREQSNVIVYVFLTSVDSAKSATTASGTVLAPKVQQELDKGLAALRQNNYAEARKHLEKAQKMAPSSPAILYLIGVVDYSAKDVPAARKQFETVLATNPNHERSLLMLGQIQFEAKEYKEASVTLQKAVDGDSNNWRAHYLLALASIRNGDLSKAAVEATRAGDLNHEKTAAMKFLCAKILLVQRKDSEAEQAFQSFIKDFPNDAAIPDARKYLDQIEEEKKSVAAAAVPLPETLPPAEKESAASVASTFEKHWAPPDVDATIPPTAPGVSCSMESVLHHAQQQILKQLADLEKFSATEKVEHQVLGPAGVWTDPVSREFAYLIFVHHSQKFPYYFLEDRNGGEAGDSFPSALATRGLLTLGFMIINPAFSKDFDFTCEGLGTLNGKPAWQLHFVQKADIPSRVSSYYYKKATYQIPLKGRVWIGANNYNILRLETTLREPVAGLRLNREQLTVDYGPVHFRTATTELWLPSRGEMYFDLMGHRYHHNHTLSNYLLFDVDSKNKIKPPPEPSSPESN
jgi:Flp pilus assembly protein TadD